MSFLEVAVRAGLLFEAHGDREIAVVNAAEYPAILGPVQQFRGAIYGDVPAVRGGIHCHAADPASWHVLVIDTMDMEQGQLIGCARYTRDTPAGVELGGFCIRHTCRGGRAALWITDKVQELAKHFGDTRGIARASIPFGSAAILRKLGGKVVKRYWDEDYRRETEILTFER